MIVLTVAGLWNSGPQHWQTLWEAKHGWKRVIQRDWDHPERREWIAALDAAIWACDEPPILAAHSLGCTLVAEWSERTGGEGVAAAFLVAPSDVETPGYPEDGRNFFRMPTTRLPFPSVLVASTNDPYITVARATEVAAHWGSRLILIGNAGHINGESGHGPWPEGEAALLELARSVI